MKKAGAKNDGAWHRANKFLQSLPSEATNNLVNILMTSLHVENAYDEWNSMKAQTGVQPGSDWPEDAQAWVLSLMQKGIPRQVWFGRPTFMVYVRSGAPGSYKYTPSYGTDAHHFAKDLRKIIRNYMFTYRQLRDIANIGLKGDNNPGGNPDANENT